MATIQTSIKIHDQFSTALKHLNQGLNSIINSFDKTNKTSKKFLNTSAINDARASLKKSQLAINDMNNSLNKLNNNMNKGASAANNLWGKLKQVASVYALIQGGKSLINAGDTYASNTARLDLINDGKQSTTALQQKIYDAANRSFGNYSEMSSTVAKLGALAGHAFKSNDEIVAFTEALNKQFTISGASVTERNNAMYQLTQAMASGRLQGDEFRTILENAPMLAQQIAKSMNVPIGKLKEMSSEGLITADIIKNALFESADEVNKKFKEMPIKFGDLMNQARNKITKGLEPIYKKLQKMWNSETFQTFLNTVVNGFLHMSYIVGAVIEGIINVVSHLVNFITSNWGVIESILIAIAIVYLPTIITLLWKKVKALCATVAAWLAAHWVVLLVIAAIVGLIYIFKQLGVTASMVIGAICGGVMWLGAVIWNVLKFIANVGSGVCQFFVNSWQWACDTISVIFGNIGIFFSNLWQNCTIVFYKFLNAIVSGLEMLATPIKALAKLFGMDLGGAFDNMHAGINSKIAEAESQKQKYGKISEFKAIDWKTYDYTNLSGAYSKGYNWGKDKSSQLFTSIGDAAKGLIPDYDSNFNSPTGLNKIGNAMRDGNQPLVDALKGATNAYNNSTDALSTMNEDMSYLREIATRDAINNITSKTVEIKMTNNNSVNSKLDLDDVVSHLQEKVYDIFNSSSEGVHI